MAAVTAPPKGGGNRGYAGYEYQILVSAWLSLELMIAKEASDCVVIEPRSEEDLEAAVKAPDSASLGLSAEVANLFVQVKSRSTSPWSSSAFAAVLKGNDRTSGDSSRSRIRPLEMLIQDSSRRYLFITNESLEASLRPHSTESVLQFPSVTELPPRVRQGIAGATQAVVAPRIAIIPSLTVEVLNSRLKQLLETYGHVPASSQDSCVSKIRDTIRARMLGEQGGRLTKNDILAVLRSHGGSILPTRMMDHYVRPQSYERIEQQLKEKHVVVIAGPSGTGKTLTADILELEYRKALPPFSVIGGENGPGPIRSQLANTHSVLFHLRDPWGSNRLTPQAEPWSSELPKLIAQAGPAHKFLITSRSDILHSAGHELEKKLGPYVVPLEVEDYGGDRLARIYDGIRSDLTGYSAELAKAYRRKALATLKRPYEIDRFLVALTRQRPEKPERVEAILAASQIDAISTVIADQISNWEPTGVAAAAVIWALLNARGALTVDAVRGTSRLLRQADSSLRPNIDGMIDFLVAGRNLLRDGTTITFYHPRVEDGLRIAIEQKRNETEYVLSRLVDGLIADDMAAGDWGVETALGILVSSSKIDGLQLSLSAQSQSRLDAFLEAQYFSARKTGDFARAFESLARYGSGASVPSMLARFLSPPPEQKKDEHDAFGRSWKAPTVAADALAIIQSYPRTKSTLEIFIREVLPFSQVSYADSLIELLNAFSPGLSHAFLDAVRTVAEPRGPMENIGVIVRGACAYDTSNFDEVIERFVQCDNKAKKWLETFDPELRKAAEHEVDAAYADHVYEQPQDEFYNSRTGLETVLGLRYEREGISWLRNHSHRELLAEHLAQLVGESERSYPPEILRELLACSTGPAHPIAWTALGKHWNEGLMDLLVAELARSDIDNDDLRHTLIRIAALPGGDPVSVIANILPEMSSARKLEVLRDVASTDLDADGKGQAGTGAALERASALSARFTGVESELAIAFVAVLGGRKLSKIAEDLTTPARDQLKQALANAPLSTAGPLACLASAAGLEIENAVGRLLEGGEEDSGLEALQALALQPHESAQRLRSALTHPRHRVRCQALQLLVAHAKTEDRLTLLEAADDLSADVRLTWAQLMEEKRWPEAIPSLIRLLGDQRNYNSDFGITRGPSWSIYRVARAAARALGVYDSLPLSAIDALLSASGASSKDPFVACAAATALAVKDDARITPFLVGALASPGLQGSPQHRPMAQAAAWALFDRAQAGMLKEGEADVMTTAVSGAASIAAPTMMAIAVADLPASKLLAEQLTKHDLSYRIELLCTAVAISHGVVLEGAREPQVKLASLYPDRWADGAESKILTEWSLSLKNERDVQGHTAWLASEVNLPVQEKPKDPRAFDLPERIGILTMRSLTPAREIGDRSPDDGR